MKSYKKWVTAGVVITMIGVLVGCGTAGNGSTPTTNTTNTTTTNTVATNNVTTGANTTVSNQTTQNTTNTSSSNQTTSNSTKSNTQTSSTAADMVRLNLTNAQIRNIEAALKHLGVTNLGAMKFGSVGAKVYVPSQVPQGEQFLNANSGVNVEFGSYVNLNFSGFTVTLGTRQSSQLAIRKSNSVKLSNGATGTWYVTDSTTSGTTYYLMTSNGTTYISFYSNLKTVSQAQFEQMAGSMVFLGAHQ